MTGELWKKLRQERMLTQNEIARAIGTTAQYVSNVERGLARFSIRQLRQLIRFMDLSPDLILGLILADEEAGLRRAFKKSCGSE